MTLRLRVYLPGRFIARGRASRKGSSICWRLRTLWGEQKREAKDAGGKQSGRRGQPLGRRRGEEGGARCQNRIPQISGKKALCLNSSGSKGASHDPGVG